MYTVLLVDDEIAVTDFLKDGIPWADLGIETIETAADGVQALERFRSRRFDLLITDIKMPRMDGLTLLTQVRGNYPETHCILLTAYGEFEYARTALRLGVENYLLKPIQIKEITETIENALDNMYASRENKELLFRENILRRWLNGSISPDELNERANILDINIYQSAYCAVCIKKANSAVSLSACGKEFITLLPASCDCSFVWDNSGNYVLILGAPTLDQQMIADLLAEAASRLSILKDISAAVGPISESSDDLSASYRAATGLTALPPDPAFSSVRICPQAQPSEENAVPRIDSGTLSPIVQKAVEYIHREYANSASIKEFCTKHTITTAYLGYLFKKETNVFFNNYLNSCRIGRAIQLLSSTSYRINEIAARSGFSNTSYFISSFKKYTGMSPAKYREQQLERKEGV